MASRPRWPWPSGSNGDGPMGSWTMPSGSKRSSQPSRSLAFTAALEASPNRRAVIGAPSTPAIAVPSLSGVDMLNDPVGEPPELVELVLQRLDGRPDLVRPPEPDDDGGDPLLLQSPAAVDAEGVHGDDVDLRAGRRCPPLAGARRGGGAGRAG